MHWEVAKFARSCQPTSIVIGLDINADLILQEVNMHPSNICMQTSLTCAWLLHSALFKAHAFCKYSQVPSLLSLKIGEKKLFINFQNTTLKFFMHWENSSIRIVVRLPLDLIRLRYVGKHWIWYNCNMWVNMNTCPIQCFSTQKSV